MCSCVANGNVTTSGAPRHATPMQNLPNPPSRPQVPVFVACSQCGESHSPSLVRVQRFSTVYVFCSMSCYAKYVANNTWCTFIVRSIYLIDDCTVVNIFNLEPLGGSSLLFPLAGGFAQELFFFQQAGEATNNQYYNWKKKYNNVWSVIWNVRVQGTTAWKRSETHPLRCQNHKSLVCWTPAGLVLAGHSKSFWDLASSCVVSCSIHAGSNSGGFCALSKCLLSPKWSAMQLL